MRKIDRARSFGNGIVFYSRIIPFMGARSEKIPSTGEIETSPVFTPFEEFTEAFNRDDMRIVNFIRFLLSGLYFALGICLLDGGIITSALFFTFLVSKKLVFLLYQSFCMHTKNGSKRSLGRFHAAEHMAVNAFNDLGRVPTLSEIKKYSKLTEHCGSMLMINDVVLNLNLCLVGLLYTRFGFFIGLGLSIATTLLLVYARCKNAFLFIQNIVLGTATDTELQVAIDGLKYLNTLEEDFKQNSKISNNEVEFRIIPICIELE